MDVRPKKHLGQHFLKDKNIARKIAESLTGSCKNIMEIGPGTGILTEYLTEKENTNLQLLEIDTESVVYLEDNFPQLKGCIHEADFLKYPLEQVFAGEEFCICGNFPYNISSQILFRMLEYRTSIPMLSGMFQKEVAERVCAVPGNKTYGILSVLVQAFYKTEYLFTVPEHVFAPPPKVKSGVIRLERQRISIEGLDEKLFFRLVKTAFNQRRKTLRNSLKAMSGGQALPGGLDGKRPEQLPYEDFIILSNHIGHILKS